MPHLPISKSLTTFASNRKSDYINAANTMNTNHSNALKMDSITCNKDDKICIVRCGQLKNSAMHNSMHCIYLEALQTKRTHTNTCTSKDAYNDNCKGMEQLHLPCCQNINKSRSNCLSTYF